MMTLRKLISHTYKVRMVACFAKWSRIVKKGGDLKAKDQQIRILEQ